MHTVDLTQPLGPQTITWPGSSAPTFTVTSMLEDEGSFARDVSLSEHAGTHVDAPAHFVEGGATVDQIPVDRLICDLAVIDIRHETAQDPDYLLSVADLELDEAAHGPVLPGGAVAVCTGWSAWAGGDAYLGIDASGGMHFPGVGRAAAEWLVEQRGVVGIGIDTPGIDRGSDANFDVHGGVTLPRGVWHLEGLVSLERVPARGATVFVGVLPLAGGSGAPARVLATSPAAV